MGASGLSAMMNRASSRALVWLAALLLAGPAAAAPAMWLIRDADTEIALFGTIHALPKGAEWQTPAFNQRFDAADTLVVETIIPEDRFQFAPLVAEIGLRPVSEPLTQRVSPAAAGAIGPAAAAAGIPLPALDRMETWLAAITLSEATLAALGISAESGVEPVLLARAAAARRPIVGLETPEEQLRFFDGLPEADQVALLEATLDDVAVARSETEKLITLWQAGDVETIAVEFSRETRASPLLAKVLLTDRNTRWADWITGVMKRPGKVFLAVGAGHFGGPEGLLKLLAERGLVAERLQ